MSEKWNKIKDIDDVPKEKKIILGSFGREKNDSAEVYWDYEHEKFFRLRPELDEKVSIFKDATHWRNMPAPPKE